MSSTPVHLLVIIHGMWGNPNHCAELARIVRERYSEPSTEGVELDVLIAKTNRAESTHDGIDWGGERVAMEVMDRIQDLESNGKEVTRFSVTGYSFGGLVGRYLIGILYQRGFFETVTPVNFHTIATPHLGVPHFPNIFSALLSSWGPRLSRTAEQFYCVDKYGQTGKPLLQVMADRERIFYRALALFPHITLYANAINDRTVPYVTAAIDIENPFAEHETNGIEVTFNKEYSPVIDDYTLPAVPPPSPSKPVILSPSWFRNRRGKPPIFLPPILQARFPFNIMVYALLPAIIPLAISMLLIYLPFGAYHSRARIRLLEKDGSYSQRLINVLADLDKNVEDTVADIIDNTGSDQSDSSTQGPQGKSILTPVQYQIAVSLNKLPITKHLAYIQNISNSHAVIVCRDIARFEIHRAGEGVVRHWAASFNL